MSHEFRIEDFYDEEGPPGNWMQFCPCRKCGKTFGVTSGFWKSERYDKVACISSQSENKSD